MCIRLLIAPLRFFWLSMERRWYQSNKFRNYISLQDGANKTYSIKISQFLSFFPITPIIFANQNLVPSCQNFHLYPIRNKRLPRLPIKSSITSIWRNRLPDCRHSFAFQNPFASHNIRTSVLDTPSRPTHKATALMSQLRRRRFKWWLTLALS